MSRQYWHTNKVLRDLRSIKFTIMLLNAASEFSPKKRGIIQVLSDEGYTQREIAERLNISQAGVSKTLKRIKDTGTFQTRKRTGRKRVTTRKVDRYIRQKCIQNPRWSAKTIIHELNIEASARTVRRRLSEEFHLKSRFPAKKPFLSKKNVADRLKFCNLHKNWSEEQWLSVMFSDETMVRQFQETQTKVRRPTGQRFKQKYTVSTVKAPSSVMVWGSISGYGRGALWIMPKNTTITAKVYLEILQDRLLTHMCIHNATHFQHDGAPVHTAKIVKAWLERNNIQLLAPWPGSSPDLNIIENCWTLLKREVSKRNPKSHQDLINTIKEVWINKITPDYCEKLARSMPKRIIEVIKNKGNARKY